MAKPELGKFSKCQICGTEIDDADYDTPLYCAKCISEMERLNLSPRKYAEYRELNETLGNKSKA